jgi:hypothetical protein
VRSTPHSVDGGRSYVRTSGCMLTSFAEPQLRSVRRFRRRRGACAPHFEWGSLTAGQAVRYSYRGADADAPGLVTALPRIPSRATSKVRTTRTKTPRDDIEDDVGTRPCRRARARFAHTLPEACDPRADELELEHCVQQPAALAKASADACASRTAAALATIATASTSPSRLRKSPPNADLKLRARAPSAASEAIEDEDEPAPPAGMKSGTSRIVKKRHGRASSSGGGPTVRATLRMAARPPTRAAGVAHPRCSAAEGEIKPVATVCRHRRQPGR